MSDLFANLALGFSTALSPINVLLALTGCLVGTLIGVLPGIGPVATIAMLLPITFHLDPVAALIMLAGIYYGAQYGGSTTAILVNMPGEATAVVTTLDGYQMARQGRAGAALGAAALASFLAGTFATGVIVLIGPPLTRVAQAFGPPEYFALMLFGLIASVVIAAGSVLKAIAMIFLGLLLGLVGADVETGVERFTFGIPQLYDGIEFTTLAVGLYGIAEILKNLAHPEARSLVTEKVTGLLPSREDFRRGAPAAIRGTLIGSALGILPGNGSVLAPFATYMTEKSISKTPREFGKGAIEGVAGPEAANNAAAQTSFIPLLT
ncbi:MAG: tripartite tricarboxylate transporter permease, partial [Pseudomonadota bacterium]|nr:tripartite tricarboxylate transporter permease [Pseudomonadota bacterium]